VEKPAIRSRHVAWSAVLFLTLATPISAHAQGCAQCRDNTAATSPATQRAYRHAIILMTGAAATLFLATLAIVRRNR
jgi:multisubunit Na+/H+ antiporter MnhG subunit